MQPSKTPAASDGAGNLSTDQGLDKALEAVPCLSTDQFVSFSLARLHSWPSTLNHDSDIAGEEKPNRTKASCTETALKTIGVTKVEMLSKSCGSPRPGGGSESTTTFIGTEQAVDPSRLVTGRSKLGSGAPPSTTSSVLLNKVPRIPKLEGSSKLPITISESPQLGKLSSSVSTHVKEESISKSRNEPSSFSSTFSEKPRASAYMPPKRTLGNSYMPHLPPNVPPPAPHRTFCNYMPLSLVWHPSSFRPFDLHDSLPHVWHPSSFRLFHLHASLFRLHGIRLLSTLSPAWHLFCFSTLPSVLLSTLYRTVVLERVCLMWATSICAVGHV